MSISLHPPLSSLDVDRPEYAWYLKTVERLVQAQGTLQPLIDHLLKAPPPEKEYVHRLLSMPIKQWPYPSDRPAIHMEEGILSGLAHEGAVNTLLRLRQLGISERLPLNEPGRYGATHSVLKDWLLGITLPMCSDKEGFDFSIPEWTPEAIRHHNEMFDVLWDPRQKENPSSVISLLKEAIVGGLDHIVGRLLAVDDTLLLHSLMAGFSPLAFAVSRGNLTIAQRFLDAGEDINGGGIVSGPNKQLIANKSVISVVFDRLDKTLSKETGVISQRTERMLDRFIQHVFPWLESKGGSSYEWFFYTGGFGFLVKSPRLIKRLMESRLDVEELGKNFNLALSALRSAAPVDSLKIMIEKGVSLDRVDSQGNTAFHCAVEGGCDFSVLEYLKMLGCDINTPNKSGETPLDILFNQNEKGEPYSPSKVKSLLSLGLDVSVVNNRGFSVLRTFTLRAGSSSSTSSQAVEVLKLLLDAGAPIEDAYSVSVLSLSFRSKGLSFILSKEQSSNKHKEWVSTLLDYYPPSSWPDWDVALSQASDETKTLMLSRKMDESLTHSARPSSKPRL